jgi:hypothetical protein
MKCNQPKCGNARLFVPFPLRGSCTQKRTERDMRPCGDVAVVVCPRCGGTHCAKHIPSVNYYDPSIKSP